MADVEEVADPDVFDEDKALAQADALKVPEIKAALLALDPNDDGKGVKAIMTARLVELQKKSHAQAAAKEEADDESEDDVLSESESEAEVEPAWTGSKEMKDVNHGLFELRRDFKTILKKLKGIKSVKTHKIWNTKNRGSVCGMKGHRDCKGTSTQQACFDCNVRLCPDKRCLNLHLRTGRGNFASGLKRSKKQGQHVLHPSKNPKKEAE